MQTQGVRSHSVSFDFDHRSGPYETLAPSAVFLHVDLHLDRNLAAGKGELCRLQSCSLMEDLL